MEKRMLKMFRRVIIPVAACLLTAVPCWGAAGEGAGIRLPDQEITSIQLNGIKFHGFAGSGKSFENFEKSLGAVRLSDDTAVRRGDIYQAVTLTFADESKETFYFFQCDDGDGRWYVEDGDGCVYQDADFIEDYADFTVVTSEETAIGADFSNLRRLIRLCSELEELDVPFGADDLRAVFAYELQSCAGVDGTGDGAVEVTRDTLTYLLMKYQYAVNHGYALTEEELEHYRQEADDILQSVGNVTELEKVFEDEHTTRDWYRGCLEEYDRITYTVQAFSEAIYEEFRQGNDRIGDYVCNDAREYLNYYLMEKVYPEMEDYRDETVIPLLDKAEDFYNEYFAAEEY